MTEAARWFSYGRQRLGRAGRDPLGVLRDVVAVSSAQPTAPLSLLARCEPLTPDAFREVVALRLPAMRGAGHLLPRETAHLAFAAVPAPATGEAELRERYELSSEQYAELRARLLDAAREPRTARELREAAALEQPVGPVLGSLTREGALVRLGPHGLRSNELFYVAAHIPVAPADEALRWLAGEYLRAYGPARRQDFAWWAGVPAQRADTALDAVDTVKLDGGLLLRSVDVPAFERVAPVRDTVDLLPRSDAYTMGYAPDGRDRFASRELVGDFYDAGGEALPTVLVDGSAVGSWGVRPGGALELELDLYEPPTPAVHRALDARAAEIRALLG